MIYVIATHIADEARSGDAVDEWIRGNFDSWTHPIEHLWVVEGPYVADQIHSALAPLLLAAAVLEVPHALAQNGLSLPLVVGVLASALSGWLAIAVLLRFVTRNSYGIFAIYRVVLGLLVLAVVFARG